MIIHGGQLISLDRKLSLYPVEANSIYLASMIVNPGMAQAIYTTIDSAVDWESFGGRIIDMEDVQNPCAGRWLYFRLFTSLICNDDQTILSYKDDFEQTKFDYSKGIRPYAKSLRNKAKLLNFDVPKKKRRDSGHGYVRGNPSLGGG